MRHTIRFISSSDCIYEGGVEQDQIIYIIFVNNITGDVIELHFDQLPNNVKDYVIEQIQKQWTPT